MTETEWKMDMTEMDLRLDGVVPGWAPHPRFGSLDEQGGAHFSWGLGSMQERERILWLRTGGSYTEAVWDLTTWGPEGPEYVRIDRRSALMLLSHLRALRDLARSILNETPCSG